MWPSFVGRSTSRILQLCKARKGHDRNAKIWREKFVQAIQALSLAEVGKMIRETLRDVHALVIYNLHKTLRAVVVDHNCENSFKNTPDFLPPEGECIILMPKSGNERRTR